MQIMFFEAGWEISTHDKKINLLRQLTIQISNFQSYHEVINNKKKIMLLN